MVQVKTVYETEKNPVVLGYEKTNKTAGGLKTTEPLVRIRIDNGRWFVLSRHEINILKEKMNSNES